MSRLMAFLVVPTPLRSKYVLIGSKPLYTFILLGRGREGVVHTF